MSMNLYAEYGSEVIELWQTPTHISYMCCMDQHGRVVEMRGRNAKRALYVYIAWISDVTGIFDSVEELNAYRKPIDDHVEYVKSFLKRDYKPLSVFVM